MRLDRLLVYLRFARTRSRAQAMIASRSLRCNRKHVMRASHDVVTGDVLTLAIGNEVRIIEIKSLPKRRGSADEARSHYHELDRAG
ncbi:MAG: S4 domain-containing protein [Pseudomonadota bacterium]